jgi:hypothetical protein
MMVMIKEWMYVDQTEINDKVEKDLVGKDFKTTT